MNKEIAMKVCLAASVVLCLLMEGSDAAIKGVVHRVGARFGPSGCVSLTRSSAGTCVLSTDCEGRDMSKTEFVFDCVGKSVVRHSFGIGGFDTQEEFDTDLKCDKCNVPTKGDAIVPIKPVVKKVAPPPPKASPPKAAAQPKHTSAKSDVKPMKLNAKVKQGSIAPKHRDSKGNLTMPAAKPKTSFKVWGASSAEEKTQKTRLRSSPEVVRYGPNGCVSVYKSEATHCIMSTNCRNSNMSDYEYGLVCVDKVGAPVKHLFGKDSFDPEESFDTLIRCNECLGLEDVPDGVVLAGEVATLAKDISGLKDALTNISSNVQLLNNEVFKRAAAPAPAPALPTIPPAPPVPKALLHRSAAHHRHSKKRKHLRHSHPRHHRHHVSRHAEEYDEADSAD